MASKLTILTHTIAIQLHLVAECCTICSSRSTRPGQKLLDIPSYFKRREIRNFITGDGHGILQLKFTSLRVTKSKSHAKSCKVILHQIQELGPMDCSRPNFYIYIYKFLWTVRLLTGFANNTSSHGQQFETLFGTLHLRIPTTWSRVLEKLPVKKFPAFYGTPRFITVFTRGYPKFYVTFRPSPNLRAGGPPPVYCAPLLT
jgi:hypothetical protein